MKKTELVFCGLLTVLSALFLLGSAFITPLSKLTITSPGAYPLFVACLCLLSSLWVFFDALRGRIKRAHAPDWRLFDHDVLCFLGIMLLYFVAIATLRYTVGTLLFLFAAVWFLEKKNILRSLTVAVIGTAVNLVIFKYIFSVILP